MTKILQLDINDLKRSFKYYLNERNVSIKDPKVQKEEWLKFLHILSESDSYNVIHTYPLRFEVKKQQEEDR